MTKNELLSFIAFENEQEKEEAEFYLSVKGVELHRRILDICVMILKNQKLNGQK